LGGGSGKTGSRVTGHGQFGVALPTLGRDTLGVRRHDQLYVLPAEHADASPPLAAEWI
jgi:hypothetical protein